MKNQLPTWMGIIAVSGGLLTGCNKTEPVASKPPATAAQRATTGAGAGSGERKVQSPADRFKNRGNRPAAR